MNRAFVALGSNLGDRRAHLALAVSHLGRTSEVVRASSLYETDPVGGPPQGPYLNAVIEMRTTFSAFRLLQVLTEIERRAGRIRTVRDGPRTLDLDLLWCNGDELRSDALTLPHPRAHERRFVLEPWVEIWPDGILRDHPLSEWMAACDKTGVFWVSGPEWVDGR